MSNPSLCTRCIAVCLAVVALLAGGLATTSDANPHETQGRTVADVSSVVELRPLSTSADHRIVDDLGRDVLLRGANLNSLGEYWRGDPSHPPTIAVTESDWAEMAARGLSAVRLIVTWSRIEPQRGVIDQSYLDEVDAQVRAAARNGVYSIIDMHQDAYSPFVATTDPASCPLGTQPGRGWDGAPAWATITDGASTCTPGDRYSAPAVFAAFNNFYDNRDGIRDHFVQSWAAVAARFAGRPEVAGYDILNEPPVTRPAAEIEPLYDALVRDTLAAIRGAESGAAFSHLVFVEPALPMGDTTLGGVIPDPARIGVDPANVVGAPHNYAESIGIPGLSLTIEGLNDMYLAITQSLGVPLWIGEYGFWDTNPETLEKVIRSAADEDRKALGGTWWQWRQSCGDPHHVQWQDGQVVAPAGVDVQLHRLGCPGNVDLGPTEEFLDVLGRAFPRATPGRIASLESNPATGQFDLQASSGAPGGELVVWTPTTDSGTHAVHGENIANLTEHAVPGGRLITATVASAGCYALHIATTTTSCPAGATTLAPGGSSPGNSPSKVASAPVVAVPRFTG